MSSIVSLWSAWIAARQRHRPSRSSWRYNREGRTGEGERRREEAGKRKGRRRERRKRGRETETPAFKKFLEVIWSGRKIGEGSGMEGREGEGELEGS